jgi:hypothetical protein
MRHGQLNTTDEAAPLAVRPMPLRQLARLWASEPGNHSETGEHLAYLHSANYHALNQAYWLTDLELSRRLSRRLLLVEYHHRNASSVYRREPVSGTCTHLACTRDCHLRKLLASLR